MRVDGQLMLLAGGVAAIVLALVWRFVSRRRQLSRFDRRLRSEDDPAARARAGNAIVELGLPRAAKPVLRAVVQEPDDRVRLSIALAIARRQWEPARAKRVASLRGWAGEELEFQGRPVRGFGPAVTRLADMGGPRPDQSNGDGNGATANGNGNGASGPGAVAPGVAYRPAEAPAPASVPPSDGGIRWVAPGIGERTES